MTEEIKNIKNIETIENNAIIEKPKAKKARAPKKDNSVQHKKMKKARDARFEKFAKDNDLPSQSLIGSRMRELRESRGFTIRQLSKKAGMPESSLREYESGYRNPSEKAIQKLATYYNVNPFYFEGRTDEKVNMRVTEEEGNLALKYQNLERSAEEVVLKILDADEHKMPTELPYKELPTYDLDKENFRTKFKEARLARGVKLIDIANALDLSLSTVNHYADGTRVPSKKVLPVLAEYLGTSVDFLMGRVETSGEDVDLENFDCTNISNKGLDFIVKYRNASLPVKDMVKDFIVMEALVLCSSKA